LFRGSYGRKKIEKGFNVSETASAQLLRHFFDQLTAALLSPKKARPFTLSVVQTTLRSILTKNGYHSLRLTPADTPMLIAFLDQHAAFRRVSDAPEWERVSGTSRPKAPIGSGA
jgi:hypothetical protein